MRKYSGKKKVGVHKTCYCILRNGRRHFCHHLLEQQAHPDPTNYWL